MRRAAVIAVLSLAVAVPVTVPGAAAQVPAAAPAPPSPHATPRVDPPLTARQADDVLRTAVDYLASARPTSRLGAGSRLVARPAQRSLGVAVQRFDQTYRGLPVIGAQLLVRLRGGTVLGTTDDTARGLTVAVAPTSAPTRQHAFAVARSSVHSTRSLRLVDRGLAVLPRGHGVLVRHVTVLGAAGPTGLPLQREVFVAAGASRPTLDYSTILPFATRATPPDGPVPTTARGYNGPALPLVVYRDHGRYLLEDTSRHATITTYRTDADAAVMPPDLSGATLVATPSLPFPSAASASGAIDAQWGAGKVLDYYAHEFGRDSLDGAGMAIRSYVGLRYAGEPMANAAWTGKEMIYGSGDAEYEPFSASLDIVGHEMTHGVIQHTARLLYYGQPGAVNEAFADYFGNAIGDDVKGIAPTDPTYSLVGEDICRTEPPLSCAKFDLSRRMTTARYYQGEKDEQGVHRNSPIVSTALWGVRRALGGGVADRLVYAALTQYLTPSSGFLAVRDAMLSAARDQGLTPADLAAVAHSFDANGIVPGWDRLRVEPGARIARRGLAYPSALVDLSGGVLVTTDMRQGRAVVLAGPATDGRQRQLPGLTADAIGQVATDGREVIALGGAVRGFHLTSTVRVSGVRGGRARTLVDLTGHARSVLQVAISRRLYAWQVRHYGSPRDTDLLVVRGHGDTGVRTRRIHPRGTLGPWAIAGHQVVYADSGSTRIRSFDAATGVVHTIWESRATAGFHPRIRALALTPHRLVVAADLHPGPATSVLSLDRSGGHRRLLLGERGRAAGPVRALDASDAATTVALPGHRLLQVRARDGRVAPVSCLPVTFAWSQGSGSRVAWVQQQYGLSAVLVRAAPRRRC